MLQNTLEKIVLRQAEYSCEILLNYGAAINSYTFQGEEFVDGYANFAQTEKQKYRGVVLAPFPNRLANASYTFEGETYTLPINREKEGLALHGFLYNKVFSVKSKNENTLCLEYSYDGSLAGFPFSFKLELEYHLNKDGILSVVGIVENIDTKPIPFGLGWHPYFKIGETIDNLHLDFPCADKILLSDKLLPTGEAVTYLTTQKSLMLAEQQWDDCFVLTNHATSAFRLYDNRYQLEVRNPSVKDYPYFQVYTPKDRKSIAIEPMTCAPNAFNNQMGVQIVQPGERKKITFSIHATRYSEE